MIRRALAIALLLGIAGCGSPEPLQTFAPLNYSYLPPITLKVATVNVVNSYAASPAELQLINEDPAPPPAVLATELARRLVGGGAPGTATATIEAASIDQAGGNLTGVLTVRIDIASADGLHTGFTEATVSHSQTAPDPDASQNEMQAALYQMTKQLMDSMNVQLQYQIQHDLPDWIVTTSIAGTGFTTAPATTIQAAPLAAPTPVTGAPTPAAPTLQLPPAATAAPRGLVPY